MSLNTILFRPLHFVLSAIVILTAVYWFTANAQANPQATSAFDVWESETYSSGSPTNRHETSFVNVDGKFYLMGGRESEDIEVYDPDTQTWTTVGSTPILIHHFQPVELNGLIYVLGAFTDYFPNEPSVDTIYIYDPADNTWDSPTEKIPSNRLRGSTGAVTYNGKIYIIGGNTLGHQGGYVPWFDEYDPVTEDWTALSDAPTARDHFTAVVIGDQLIVAGGRQTGHPTLGVWGATISTIDIYDFTLGTWQTLPTASNIPTPRAGAMNVAYGNEVIVVGGESSQSTAHDEVEALDITTGQWRTLDDLITGRHGGGAVINNNCIYTVAGSSIQGSGAGSVLDTMERYTFNTPNSGIHITDTVVSEAAPTVSIQLDYISPDCQSTAQQDINVDYVTSNGSATAGQDYTAMSGTATILTGENNGTITIPITADTLDENNETFTITLSNPVNASIGTMTATVTITDDDDPPALSVSNTTVNEADGTATLNVSLDQISGKSISVMYATSNGSATAGQDYTAMSGTATISAGESQDTITVPITADTLDENNETFTITLSNPVNASIGTANATITITDDDNPPALSISNATVNEADGTATFNISLDQVSGRAVSVMYATGDDSATAGQDYTASSGTVNIPIGNTSTTITVPILNDTLDEASNEQFFVNLSNPINASLANAQGVGTIIDDETAGVYLAEAAVSMSENSTTVEVIARLSLALNEVVTVDYTSTNGTATADDDYTAVSGTLTFTVGMTQTTILLPIINETIYEDDETVVITLSNPQSIENVELITASDTTTVTITNDDPFPTALLDNNTYSTVEGGQVMATIQLSNPADRAIEVPVATTDGSATAPDDYTAINTITTFNPLQISQAISILTIDDMTSEMAETFTLNAASATATVTIVDNDNGLQVFLPLLYQNNLYPSVPKTDVNIKYGDE